MMRSIKQKMFCKIRLYLTAALFCTSIASTSANAQQVCHPYSDFLEAGNKFEICDDNSPLGFEALNCFQNYETWVTKGKDAAQQMILIEAKKQQSIQADSYDRTKVGYENAAKLLQQLIDDGKTALDILKTYKNKLNFPEDADEPDFIGMSTEEYLKSEKCYDTPRNAIVSARKMTRQLVKELERFKASLLDKSATAQSRSQGVQALPINASAASTKAQGSAKLKPVPSGSGSKPASDITGAKKAIDEKNKGNSVIQQQK